MSKQEAFDKALAGIRNQGYQRSIHPGRPVCTMQGPNGTKCAVAHAYLVGTDSWSPELSLLSHDEVEWSFVRGLRLCHDQRLVDGPQAFEAAMQELAATWNLTYTRPQ